MRSPGFGGVAVVRCSGGERRFTERRSRDDERDEGSGATRGAKAGGSGGGGRSRSQVVQTRKMLFFDDVGFT